MRKLRYRIEKILKVLLKICSPVFLVALIIFFFSKEDSLVFNVSGIIFFFSGLFVLLIFVYFLLTNTTKISLRVLITVIKHLLSRLKNEPLIILNLTLVIAILVVLSGFDQRLNLLEERFGGRERLACSEEEMRENLSKSVVRIIGSYGEGSGFPVNENSIITNFHVIEGEPSPKVVFPDGSIESPTQIYARKTKDFAILKIDREMDLIPVYGWFGSYATSTNLSIGEPLYAFGYPLGSQIKGDPAMIKGSYAGRRWLALVNMNVIESNIGLVKGMSGGPLVDSCGQVVGVNTLGIGGLSMFLDMFDVGNGYFEAQSDEIIKIEEDLTTPEGVVRTFYNYIKARNLEKAYELVSSERKSTITSFEEWTQGYSQTLQVDIIDTRVDSEDENKVEIKIESQDWVDGELVYKDFQGYWQVVDEDGRLKLNESNIKEIGVPPWDWYYLWSDEEE